MTYHLSYRETYGLAPRIERWECRNRCKQKYEQGDNGKYNDKEKYNIWCIPPQPFTDAFLEQCCVESMACPSVYQRYLEIERQFPECCLILRERPNLVFNGAKKPHRAGGSIHVDPQCSQDRHKRRSARLSVPGLVPRIWRSVIEIPSVLMGQKPTT